MSEPKYDKDSMKNILVVSLLVCLACSVVVSSDAVFLKPQTSANTALVRTKHILESSALYTTPPGHTVVLPAHLSHSDFRIVVSQYNLLLSHLISACVGSAFPTQIHT